MDSQIDKHLYPIYPKGRCQGKPIVEKRIHFLNGNFMRRYQDRILFGSDAIIGEVENVQSALKFLERFLGSEEIFYKLVNENYLSFHGISKGT
jgi:hypothetical protein